MTNVSDPRPSWPSCCYIFSVFVLLVKRRKTVRRTWTKEEHEVVYSGLKRCFVHNVLPGKLECESLIRKNPVLSKISWSMVKSFVRTRQMAVKRKIKPLYAFNICIVLCLGCGIVGIPYKFHTCTLKICTLDTGTPVKFNTTALPAEFLVLFC